MPQQPASGGGGWVGAASWGDLPEAAPPTEVQDDPSGPSGAGAGADATGDERLARARAALARAEQGVATSGGPAPGSAVPDFLPPEAAAVPTAWEDLRDPSTSRSDGGAEPARGRGRRGRFRPARKGRAEDPPTDGAAAMDAEPDHEEVARQIVLRQLAMAPRSRAQLESKLRQRDCPEAVIERVLDRMTEVGLVDDEAYAAMLVRSQQATKGLAKRALAHELRKKGIDKDLADAALDEIDPAEERRTARALVDKKLRTMGGLGVDVQTRRLAGMLARKGYPPGIAYAVIRDAVADAPEHRRD